MKRLSIVCVILFVFAIPAYAQMGSQQGRTDEGKQTPMMSCPMMQQMPGQGMTQGGQQMPMSQKMMGQGMMMRDMMQMMTDMMKIQQKTMRGMSPVEKKEVAKELEAMIHNMDKMTSDMRCMMMGEMTAPQEELKKEEYEKGEPPKADSPKKDSPKKDSPQKDPHGH